MVATIFVRRIARHGIEEECQTRAGGKKNPQRNGMFAQVDFHEWRVYGEHID